jgi:hypothetical protein
MLPSQTASLPSLTIRISGLPFSIPARYSPGHILSAAEAHALNGLLAENVRNNVSSWAKGPDDAEQVYNYAAAYQFPERPRERRESRIERYCREVAEELSPQLGLPVNEILRAPAVLAEASRRLEVDAQAAAAALDDLLGT